MEEILPLSKLDTDFILKYIETGNKIAAIEYANYPLCITDKNGNSAEINGKTEEEILKELPNLSKEEIHKKIFKIKSDKANEIINRKEIKHEIKIQTNRIMKDNIADATEVMWYFTQVMRGNLTDQFGLEAPLAERTKAAIELAKRTWDIENKLNQTQQPTINITLDWTRAPENVNITEIN